MRVALSAGAPFGGWGGLKSHHLSPIHNSSLTTALATACLAFWLATAACTVPTNTVIAIKASQIFLLLFP